MVYNSSYTKFATKQQREYTTDVSSRLQYRQWVEEKVELAETLTKFGGKRLLGVTDKDQPIYVRYSIDKDTLDINYKGKNIAEVLQMTIEEGLAFFKNVPKAREILQTLMDVGCSYIRLGQSSTTLSGGEAQRIKLSRELSKRVTGNTLILLDEPTTGLAIHDVSKLLEVLHRLSLIHI